MNRRDVLLGEFTHEASTTRKHLARIPDDRWDWRPHARSSSLAQLACHLVDCARWTPPIFHADELDLDANPMKPFAATSILALIEMFDKVVDASKLTMQRSPDADAASPWRLRMRGKVWFEKPREAAFRDMSLNHLIHHRGQLSVYLRLLDVPVPGSYGPTADER